MDQKKLIILSIVIAVVLFFLFTSFVNKKKESTTENSLKTISAEEWKNLHQENSEYIVLDVRTQEEYDKAHIKDSTLIDFYKKDFKDQLKKLDKSKTYLIYCRSGNRSGKTLKIMKELGFNVVYDLDGGIKAWNGAEFPTE